MYELARTLHHRGRPGRQHCSAQLLPPSWWQGQQAYHHLADASTSSNTSHSQLLWDSNCTNAHPRVPSAVQSVKDLITKQEGPPPGGFPAIRYARRLPSTGPTGATLFAVGAAISAYGFYKVGIANEIRRCVSPNCPAPGGVHSIDSISTVISSCTVICPWCTAPLSAYGFYKVGVNTNNIQRCAPSPVPWPWPVTSCNADVKQCPCTPCAASIQVGIAHKVCRARTPYAPLSSVTSCNVVWPGTLFPQAWGSQM